MKRRIFKLKKLINKPIFVTCVKIAVVILATTLLTLFLYYLKKNNPPNIETAKKGDYAYTAKNGVYSASFGEKGTNVAKVSFAIGDNEISFTPASGQVKEHKVVK